MEGSSASVAGEYILEYDLNGIIIGASQDFIRLTGYTLNELLGLNHSNIIVQPDYSEKGYELFWNELKDGKTHDQSNRLILGNNEFKVFETYIPKRNSKGFVAKVIAYIDIFVKTKDNSFEQLQSAENDLSNKRAIKDTFVQMSTTQRELMEKQRRIRERAAELLKGLDDSLKESY